MRTWFTSDLHFCHKNIIRLCGRPFESIDDMNETLVANFNAVVAPDDMLYILGDVNYKGNADSLVARLNGRKTLILGNHDSDYAPELFEQVLQLHEVNVQAKGRHRRFVLCHYPLVEWNGFYKGAIHLHGHQHNKPEYNGQMRHDGLLRYDVGVDANGFFPVSAEDIVSFFGLE